ncbi:MAG: efflux RND transporter periplasmic adaptor subunit [Cellvibrionaceae bacterium]
MKISPTPIPTPLILLFLALAACTSDAPTERSNGPQGTQRVIVEAITETPLVTRVEAVGTSRAAQSITLYPAASGEVVAVNFEAGQAVEQGDVLLELDQRDELLAVQLAEVRVADAERLHRRYVSSAESGATLPTTLDASATALEEAHIELGRARIALEDRSVKAPFAGHVGITDVDAGDRIQPSTAITTLDSRGELLVSFEVPEILVDTLRTGDAVAIATWNSREPAAYGEIVNLGSRVDPDTRTFVARARVDNSEDRLRPGQSFRVTLEIFGSNYPVLPEVALQWGVDGAYVWSVVGSEARRLPVSVIQRQRGRVLVDGELSEGDLVVVEGIQRMRPGIEVNPERTEIASDDEAMVPNSDKGPG